MAVRWRGSRSAIVAGVAAVLLAATTLAACGGSSDGTSATPAATGGSAVGAEVGAGAETLLEAQALTVLDQPIAYPKKKAAQVSSSIVQLEPGQETGWHKHNVPLYAYVLEGAVTVEYDAGVVKVYPAGTALMEAQGVWHNGTNQGDTVVRILTVYLGAKGVKNTVERDS